MSKIRTRPKLYIHEAFLKGFKSIDNLQIKLNKGLNIIIGQNGAGKSNFLEFLYNTISSIYQVPDLTFKSAQLVLKSTNDDEINYQIERTILKKSQLIANEDLYTEPYHQTLKINNELAFDSANDEGISQFNYHNRNIKSLRSIRLIFSKIGYPFILPEYIRYTLPQDLSGVDEPLSTRHFFSDYDFFSESVSDSKLINDILLDLQKILSSEHNEEINEVEHNLHEKIFLESIKKIDADYILNIIKIDEHVISNLTQFTPIKNLRVNENINVFNDDKNLIIENIRLEFFVNDRWLPWSQLSDGTKRLFFIVSEISLNSDGTILIEEPELGVHPHQFDLLMQFLEEQSATKQIIMSTHSPKALDILDATSLDKIFIAKYEQGKGTIITNLNHKQKEKANNYMNEVGFLSDYWLLSDLEE